LLRRPDVRLFELRREVRPFRRYLVSSLFFFKDTAPTGIYTLSLHDALPISASELPWRFCAFVKSGPRPPPRAPRPWQKAQFKRRSEEHTSELQSRGHLVCRLLLEKKKASTATLPACGPAPRRPAVSTPCSTP